MTAQSEGPFTVRVERACDCGGSRCTFDYRHVVSLMAVEDLRAAHLEAHNSVMAPRKSVATAWDYARWHHEVEAISASGGSIDLLGGERITVEPTTWERLAEGTGWSRDEYVRIVATTPTDEVKRRILAAWNERCGVQRQEARR
jgi:hypothetical protein